MPKLEVTMQTAVDWFLGAPVKVVSIILIAIVIRALTLRAVSRIIRRASHSEQRANSVIQLLRSIISTAVWVIAGVMALSNLGFNVGPILASAGVVGVALGFGAQTLVKDYLAGIFMILEGQFSVGDLVDVGPAMGTIEEIGLRVTRLRDVDNTVWYMRNGEVLRIANHSQ